MVSPKLARDAGYGILFVVCLSLGCSGPPNSLNDVYRSGRIHQARAALSWIDATRGASKDAAVFLRHHDPRIRAYAVLVLGRLAHDGYAPSITTMLQDTDWTVRRQAAFALGQWRSSRGCNSLSRSEGRRPWGDQGDRLRRQLHKEAHPVVRWEMYRALGRCPNGLNAQHVMGALPEDRAAALVAYGVQASSTKAVNAPDWIASVLDDPDANLRTAAFYALSRMRARLTRPLQRQALVGMSRLGSERDAALRLLTNPRAQDAPSTGLSVLDSRLSAHEQAYVLPSGDSALAWSIGTARLASLASRAHGSRRVGSLITPDWLPLAYATRALVLGRSHRFGELQTLVADVLPDISTDGAVLRRQRAVVCSSPTESFQDVCTLEDRIRWAPNRLSDSEWDSAVNSSNPGLQLAALQTLTAHGPSDAVQGAVVRALGSPDGPVRGAAASVLSKFTASAEVVDALCDAYERTPVTEVEVASSLIQALQRWPSDKPSPSCRLRILRDAHVQHRALRDVVDASMAEGESRAFNWSEIEAYQHSLAPVRVQLLTDAGTLVLELDQQYTPNTTRNMLSLVEKGYFDGLSFHRVVPNFVVQGGDPRGDGWGGPGYTIADENAATPYVTGTVGMALAGRDTGGSQFFITLSPQPHLYGRYPAFGRVVEGMDIALRIFEGDRIRKALVE